MNKYTFSFFISVIFTGVVFSQPLFNGKDLSGWTMDVPALDKKPNLAKPFIVRNGMLVSLGKPAGHLLTENEYSNYRLEVEYRFAAKPGNCGAVQPSKLRAYIKCIKINRGADESPHG